MSAPSAEELLARAKRKVAEYRAAKSAHAARAANDAAREAADAVAPRRTVEWRVAFLEAWR